MRGRVVSIMLGLAAIAGGCTTTGTPATAPPTTTLPPATSTSTSTSTLPTSTTITTTTTLDRRSQVQAIFDDLEHRRLSAISESDLVAFRDVFARDAYFELEREAFDRVEVLDPRGTKIEVKAITVDQDKCIAADVRLDASTAVEGGGSGETTMVIELVDDRWGISWVGDGWECNGPHPLG